MTQRTKNNYIAIGAAAFLIGLLLYFVLVRSGENSVAPGIVSAPATRDNYSIDTAIFSDPRFQLLLPPRYPQVTSGEIGNDNPFISPRGKALLSGGAPAK